ncbi:MCE family protein [Rhodococcus erythropolis]|uniref:MCE family protein n=1 Tax=Rhodococcus erythropolis TaxID=1833 RepID=UPI001E6543CC|nr:MULTISPECIES: MCE family protein [Rhodococcus erythropolis group]MCD2107913.1 MCE family protein [Rhodococcus qingshengii]MCZ4527084.1 MCE family protein [Rhodococcus erythropolis]
MKNRFQESAALRLGIVGTILIVLVTTASLELRSLQFVSSGSTYSALFTDTGGLKAGDSVRVAGVTSGTVTKIDIDGTAVSVGFTVNESIVLGEQSRADIATATLLGTKELRVTPDGTGRLSRGSTIGLDHTSSPYNLTDALGDLTDTSQSIDTDQLAESMRSLTRTLERTPNDLRAAVDGVAALSDTVNSRDDAIRQLLTNAEHTTTLLAERSDQINLLIVDANNILGELDSRRIAVETLFANISSLANHLTGLVHDNESELAPTLTRLESVLDVLRNNKDSIAGAIEGLGPYVTELGEAVASGPFFNSYIQNLIPGQIIAPYVDAALQRYGDLLPPNPPTNGGTP